MAMGEQRDSELSRRVMQQWAHYTRHCKALTTHLHTHAQARALRQWATYTRRTSKAGVRHEQQAGLSKMQWPMDDMSDGVCVWLCVIACVCACQLCLWRAEVWHETKHTTTLLRHWHQHTRTKVGTLHPQTDVISQQGPSSFLTPPSLLCASHVECCVVPLVCAWLIGVAPLALGLWHEASEAAPVPAPAIHMSRGLEGASGGVSSCAVGLD